MTIKYYSTHCGVCETLSWLLNKTKLPYDLIDDVDEVYKIGKKYNHKYVPFAIIDGTFYDAVQLNKFIMERLEIECNSLHD